jgi:hypothetical protein
MPTTTLQSEDRRRAMTARAQAQRLMDGLLEAYVANQRAAETARRAGPTSPRPVDVARLTLGEKIAATRRLIDQLDRTLNQHAACDVVSTPRDYPMRE